MIWTEGWYHAEHEQPGCWAWSMSLEEHSDSRWAILWRYRLGLARAEAAALRARLDEERLVADTAIRSLHLRLDTAIRSLHLRLDAAEEIVRLATGLTFHPPGSLAHSQHLLELAALVEERRRNQRAPDAQDRTAP